MGTCSLLVAFIVLTSHGMLSIPKLPECCPPLPVGTMEDLLRLNTYLADEAKLQQMCVYYGTGGGTCVANSTRRVLASILTNGLATLNNWKGTGGRKHPFQQYTNVLALIKTLPAVISGSTLNQHNFSNGVIQLIIEAYTEEVLREMDSLPEFQLTDTQYSILRQRMKALYDHIRHHPALHQRYLWVGKGRPDIDPDIRIPTQAIRQSRTSSKRKRYLSENTSDQSHEIKPGPQKKAKASFPAEEICKTNRQWEQINSTKDFYDNEVEVIQDNVQQYVFSYRCVSETGPCIGISPLYESECTERYGWMYMYYRRIDDPFRTPQWGFVAAPHHCACKITPKYIPDS